MNFRKRLAALIKRIDEESAGAFLVTNATNVTYLTGFRGHDSFLLITGRKRYFITDSRYLEEARDTVKGFELVLVKESTYDAVASVAKDIRAKEMGFEAMSLPYGAFSNLRKALKGVRLVPLKDIVEGLRTIKDSDEMSAIRKAAALTGSIYKNFRRLVRTGVTEEGLSRALKADIAKSGAETAFDPVVAFDADAAKPHAIPGKAKVGRDCVIMADMGVKLNGYNSDMTRTILLGDVKPRVRKIFDIVRKALDIAIEKIAPGVKASEIDSAARGFIRSGGYGGYFGHALGHGVGMDVHEGPSISRHNSKPLEEGMVFTVEPAIYIPKFCGVRIEEMVLVTGRGCEVITGGAQ